MLNGYRTLAATGEILGVSAQRVLDLVERGPLVGRQMSDGSTMIHAEDLAAFRRPFPASVFPGYSALGQLAGRPPEEESESLQVATIRRRAVAKGRNTMASAAFRALRNLDDVRAASERFDRFVSPEPNTGCAIWTGAMDRHGYGYFRLTSAVVVFAHRYAFVRANGPIAEGLDVDHARCNTRWCCEPGHLEAVTHAENIRRRDARLHAQGTHNFAAAQAFHSVRFAARHLRLVTS